MCLSTAILCCAMVHQLKSTGDRVSRIHAVLQVGWGGIACTSFFADSENELAAVLYSQEVVRHQTQTHSTAPRCGVMIILPCRASHDHRVDCCMGCRITGSQPRACEPPSKMRCTMSSLISLLSGGPQRRRQRRLLRRSTTTWSSRCFESQYCPKYPFAGRTV